MPRPCSTSLGAPKMHAELKTLGKNCNLKTVQSIMRRNVIRAVLESSGT